MRLAGFAWRTNYSKGKAGSWIEERRILDFFWEQRWWGRDHLHEVLFREQKFQEAVVIEHDGPFENTKELVKALFILQILAHRVQVEEFLHITCLGKSLAAEGSRQGDRAGR